MCAIFKKGKSTSVTYLSTFIAEVLSEITENRSSHNPVV